MTRATPDTRVVTEPIDVVASCALLSGLAIAQPLLDLLGRNAEFFVVRDSPTVDIVALSVIVAIALPIILAVVTIVISRINNRAGSITHGAILLTLGAMLVVPIIGRTPLRALPGWLHILLATAVAVAFLFVYLRSQAIRTGIRWGVLVPIAVLGLFLFGSATSQLVIGSPAAAAAAADVDTPAPIVLVVFDALPVSDLMDRDGNLDEKMYPNFGRLAQEGTWFRNAITVHFRTEESVPAILSGVETEARQLPTLHDHPDNLFTILADTYEITAVEPITRLCPQDACHDGADASTVTANHRWTSLISDLRIVAGHLFLPADLTADLPPIDDTWGGFDDVAASPETREGEGSEVFDVRSEFWTAVDQDRRKPIIDFIESMKAPEGQPTFHFLHALVPHGPWTYLPTGQLLDLPEGRLPGRAVAEGWVDDPWMIDQVYQLHLLQVQYADTVVGLLIDRLEELGVYDDTLIVVMSDHGESFRPGMTRHRGSAEIINDILPVPLFIKAPYQEEGGIDDYRALTTDVLPTVAEILGVDLTWSVAGTSLVSSVRPTRTSTAIQTVDGTIAFGSAATAARDRALERVTRFGSESPFGLAPKGYSDLLGDQLDAIQLSMPYSADVTLRDPGRWTNVDTNAEVLPVTVRGRIEGGTNEEVVVAVALNGEIVAVTRSYVDANGNSHFDALLPPDALRDGTNDLELVQISGVGAARTFHALG